VVHQRNRRTHSEQGFFGSLDAPWSEWSWINLFSKEMQNLFFFYIRIHFWIFLTKRTLCLGAILFFCMCRVIFFELAILICVCLCVIYKFLYCNCIFLMFLFFQMVEWQSVDKFSTSSFITVIFTIAISFILVSACPNYILLARKSVSKVQNKVVVRGTRILHSWNLFVFYLAWKC